MILLYKVLKWKTLPTYNSKTNILVVGCGAGLRAAIEIKSLGLDVKILGKRPKTDAHTVLAAGGINAALANLDAQDSWEQHFIDTYLEGYGLGDPNKSKLWQKNHQLASKKLMLGSKFCKT